MTVAEAATRSGIARLKWDLLERGGAVELTHGQRDRVVRTVGLDAVSAHALSRLVPARDRVEARLAEFTQGGLAIVVDGRNAPLMTSTVWKGRILIAEMDQAPWLSSLPGDVQLIGGANARRRGTAKILTTEPSRSLAVERLEAAHPPPGDWIGAAAVVEVKLTRLTADL